MSSSMPRSHQLQSLSASLIAARQEKQTLLAMPTLRLPEFATAMDISISTARIWVKSGLVKAFRTGAAGRWRVPLSELARLKGQE
jgi:hypothetical protein